MRNGVLLPFVLVFMLLLVNQTDLMGRHKNGRLYKLAAWTLTVVITALTVVMLIKQ